VQQGTRNLTRSQNSIKTDQSREEANLLSMVFDGRRWSSMVVDGRRWSSMVVDGR